MILILLYLYYKEQDKKNKLLEDADIENREVGRNPVKQNVNVESHVKKKTPKTPTLI